ncbi:hypothetical protein TREMEDRAFT_68167 [Tremella mesenterica DSM 1558]|uniref:uncharacterized protein n=1 Tax=Tremella mesenterica (strain ATCC 24925 / CBS 8224 / DSM 1558 / NBRC 9311 / NRRL Y-6157 / RJB 2259-6 / UBC 559-6) TaxID=578456 RepID=UPI0003F49846|nr:uncharacterized protein TREMEDRAFT_68167 [Tremella mesenterica DSM 1558]EIW70675.1 hypothetical protein TREMEDRAFT_68167 [Tremella mesenterica DSM 1558]
MSDFQKARLRALELQKQKDVALLKEREAKAQREKQLAQEAEEKRRRVEALQKEARRLELINAHEALKAKQSRPWGTPTPVSAPVMTKQDDYDPFAEDVFIPSKSAAAFKASIHSKPKSSTTKLPSRLKSESGPQPRTKSSKASKEQFDELSLSRKERAARAFLIKAKRSTGDSIRALVDGMDSSGNSIHKPIPTTSSSRPKPLPTTTKKTEIDGLQKLCADREIRDRRTVDEIHRDIKARKTGSSSGATMETSRSRTESRSVSPMKKASSRSISPPKTKLRIPIPTSARPLSPDLKPIKRQRSSAADSETSESDSEDEEEDSGKRRRISNHSPKGIQLPSRDVISSEIQAIFRRPGRTPKPVYEDEDSGSDMEAGFEDLEREERRAARIARLEDEQEERKERERREAKLRVKRERERV